VIVLVIELVSDIGVREVVINRFIMEVVCTEEEAASRRIVVVKFCVVGRIAVAVVATLGVVVVVVVDIVDDSIIL
jgi:hypothetical protein